MDYIDKVNIKFHSSWQTFFNKQNMDEKVRIILLTTKGCTNHIDFEFQYNDILLLGRESAGVPEAVHIAVDASITIPMAPETRSLNIATSAAIVLGEALRQTDAYPK